MNNQLLSVRELFACFQSEFSDSQFFDRRLFASIFTAEGDYVRDGCG